jgi:hypothetical protein
MLRLAALATGLALALVAAESASAEIVARGVRDGLLALGPKGTPSVAFVRGTKVVVSTRLAKRKWQAASAATVTSGSQVMAFAVGRAGPVALVQSADNRRLFLVRRHGVGWQTVRVAGGLPAGVMLGWPGLVLDRKGLPVLGYARWNSLTLDSLLLTARVDAKGKVRSQRITAEGFPQSLVPPPAAPVLVGGTVHVVESYGYRGVLGTFEWVPQRHTWIGHNLNSGIGDFPMGPVVAGLSRDGILHAAWTESLVYYGSAPVTLASRDRESRSEFVLDRALTTALVLPASGPEVAANEWVSPEELGLAGERYAWAGTVVHDSTQIELDGWLGGLVANAAGGRDLLLAGDAGLSWFRSVGRLGTRVTIEATDEGDGRVTVSGEVRGVASGRVTIYRERPGSGRRAVGKAAVAGGTFSFVDRPPSRPLVYRAVYVAPQSGIPYAALSRDAIY